MSELPGRSPADRGRTGGAWRVAAVAVLLAVTVAGLRAHGTFSRAAHSAAAGVTGSVLTVVLTAGEGVALVAFILVLAVARPQRKIRHTDEPPRPPFPWWAKPLGVLVSLAVLVTPFVVLFSKKSRKNARPPQLTRPGAVPSGAVGRLAHPAHGASWLVIVGMVVAIALVVALTIWSRRRRPADRPRHWSPRLAGLIDSLAAGHEVLTSGLEPRAAIIACYAAMERGFAAAGSVPAAADTPAEVLARAAEAGIIRSSSPEMLTGLFRRARYSQEPITTADSGAAATALAQMRADLVEGAGR